MLRIVPHTVPRVGRYEQVPDLQDLGPLQQGKSPTLTPQARNLVVTCYNKVASPTLTAQPYTLNDLQDLGLLQQGLYSRDALIPSLPHSSC